MMVIWRPQSSKNEMIKNVENIGDVNFLQQRVFNLEKRWFYRYAAKRQKQQWNGDSGNPQRLLMY